MAKDLISLRVSALTNDQITALSELWGMTRTEVISICVDRVFRSLNPDKLKELIQESPPR